MSSDNFNFRLLSLNVRGLNNTIKRKHVFNWLKKQNADIFFLQEVHSTQKVEGEWKTEWRGEVIFPMARLIQKGLLY